LVNNHEHSRVLMYINFWLTYMCFFLRRNISDHRDISCFSFFNKSNILFMINVYSDNHQAALKYLKNTEANIHNVLVMAKDFNIRDREWAFYLFYLTHNNTLLEIANSFKLKISSPIHQVPTYYTNNSNNSNSVINLMFFYPNSVKINNYYILSEIQHLLDHVPLTVNISIMEKFIQDKWHTIIRNSKEEENFILELKNAIGNINTSNILDKESLESIVQARISEFT